MNVCTHAHGYKHENPICYLVALASGPPPLPRSTECQKSKGGGRSETCFVPVPRILLKIVVSRD